VRFDALRTQPARQPQTVVAGLGRFGPYVKHGDDYRSLESTDDLFSIDLVRAIELLAAPKRSGRRQATARRVIAKIEVPGGGTPLQVLEGRYGPYITDGETNASVPRGMDPATISLEDAQALLEARRGAAPAGRKRRPAAAARKRKPRTAADAPNEPVVAAAGPSRKHALPKKVVTRKRPRA